MTSRNIGKAMGVVLAAGLSLFGAGAAWAQLAIYPPGGQKLTKFSNLPDWNGIWERGGDIVWDDRIPAGVPQVPPYNDEYKKLAAQPQRPRTRATGGLTMPAMMTMIFPMEIELNEREMVILTESGGFRRIYTDGRLHHDDPIPSPNGHSIGYWKNKELFVDTCCFQETTRLPGGGPHSDALHVTERFYAKTPTTLVDEVTVQDPKAFTKPWTTVKTYYHRPDWEALDTDRDENDRDPPAARGGAQAAPGR